jgi:hypothetical protein
MTAARDRAITPADVFRARAEARALLWRAGELDLHDAVDGLQHAAERALVAGLGQDAVQAIIAAAFAAVRDDLDVVPDVLPAPIEPADMWTERAAEATVEALVYALRTDGCAALERQRQRLLELSPRQLEDVVARLARLRGQTDELVLALAELLP